MHEVPAAETRPKRGRNAAEMRPKCGRNAAETRPYGGVRAVVWTLYRTLRWRPSRSVLKCAPKYLFCNASVFLIITWKRNNNMDLGCRGDDRPWRSITNRFARNFLKKNIIVDRVFENMFEIYCTYAIHKVIIDEHLTACNPTSCSSVFKWSIFPVWSVGCAQHVFLVPYFGHQ